MGVGVLGGAQDGADINTGLETLLAQSQALELLEPVPLRSTVDDGVAEDVLPAARDKDCCLTRGGTGSCRCGSGGNGGCAAASGGVFGVGGSLGSSSDGVLELPRVAVPVVDEAGVVVTLVEVLEDGGEDLGFFVGEGYSLALRLEELASAGGLEEGRLEEDVLVSGKQSALASHGQGDDG